MRTVAVFKCQEKDSLSSLKVAFRDFDVDFGWEKFMVGDLKHETLGPHNIFVTSRCENKQQSNIYAYVNGTALVDIPLIEKSPNQWVGQFFLPIDGEYEFHLKTFCYDAKPNGNGKKEPKDVLVQLFQVQHSNQKHIPILSRKGKLLMDEMITDGAWISQR